MDVALPYQLQQHGAPIEAQASKRVKRDVRDSPTYGDIEENATNSPGVSDSEAFRLKVLWMLLTVIRTCKT